MNLMEQCPQYYRCNAPKCPLDSERKLRIKITDDFKCKLQKRTLKRLKSEL